MNVVCFHNPDEENGYLSNWYLSDFTCGGVAYTSLEQYMMHKKALRFHDAGMAERIMATTDVARIKQLGRESQTMTTTSGTACGKSSCTKAYWPSSRKTRN